MTDSKKISRSGFKLTEGLLLALAPAFAYLVAFYYEKGFAGYFGIPEKLIQVGIIEVFVFSGVLLSITVFLIYALNFFNLFYLVFDFEKVKPAVRFRIFALLPLAIFVIVIIYFFGITNWKNWLWAVVFFLLFTIVEFVLPLFTNRNVSGYRNKLEAQDDIDNSVDGVYTTIGKRYGFGILLFLCMIIVSIFSANLIGIANAMNQKKFLVLNTTPEMVVLRIYGEKMITAPVDRKSQTFENKFMIKILGSDDTLVLSPENIGPLRFSKPSLTPTNISTPSPKKTNRTNRSNLPIHR